MRSMLAPGRADEVGQDGADEQEERVDLRRRLEVALEDDAAGDDEQGREEQEERGVVLHRQDELVRGIWKRK